MEHKNKSKKWIIFLVTGIVLLAAVAGTVIGLRLTDRPDAPQETTSPTEDGDFNFVIDDVREPVTEEFQGQEKESNHILDAMVLGLWNDARVNGGSLGPRKSYDNKKASRWNPSACTGFLGDPSIVYLLDGYYNMDTWEMIFTVRESFFRIYVSKDGQDFRLLQDVNKENYKDFYATEDDKFIFTLNTAEAKDVVFVKIVFTGSNSDNNSPWVSLNAVKCVGERLSDGPQEMPEFYDPYKITPMELKYHKLIGSWFKDQQDVPDLAPEKTYDGNIYSAWNPGAQVRFEGDPGIIYKLADVQNIGKIQIYFGKYKHYFDLYVSKTDGNYQKVASISFANEDEAYTQDQNGAYICTLDGLNLTDIEYVKLMFTGRDDGGNWIVMNEVILHEEGAAGASTSWMLRTEPLSTHPWISGSQLVGQWKNDRNKDLKWSRYQTYDRDVATFWNPEAQANYAGQPGVVYTLQKAMNLNKLQLTFGKDIYYFDVFTSTDGKNYTQLADISHANADEAYTKGANGTYICTLEGMQLKGVKAIKVVFTGRKTANAWVSLYEVDVSEKGATGVDTSWMMRTEPVSKHPVIDSVKLIGSWNQDRKDDARWGLMQTIDEDKTTFWNPEAMPNYSGEPGVVFTLKQAMNIKKMTFDFGANVHYFDVLVSADSSSYTQIAKISAANEERAYASGSGLCTLDGLELSNIKYVKLQFTGRQNGKFWVSFYEADFSKDGTSGLDTSWMLNTTIGHATIATAEPIGLWNNLQANSSWSVDKTFDGKNSTFWNPEAMPNYSGEPGVIFTLKQAMNIKKMTFDFGANVHYFDIFVSADGESYTQIAAINSVNENKAYAEGSGLCTLDGLALTDIRFVKILFTGRQNGKFWVSFYEADFSAEGADGLDNSWLLGQEEAPEQETVIIESAAVNGTWVTSQENTAYGPQKSCDSDVSTFWNPGANPAYAGKPGIVYTLNKYCDLASLVMTFGTRYFFFDVEVSVDGNTYTQIASVTPDNHTDYYTDGYVCTIDELTADFTKYIKITFTGDSQNRCWVSLYDVALTGSASEGTPVIPDVPETQQAPVIVSGVPTGNWVMDRIGSASVAPEYSYDDSLSTMWNPQAEAGYPGEPGIIYTLDDVYDITQLQLVHKHRHYYYTVAVSTDGVSYTTIATVDASTAPALYSADNTCTLAVNAENVQYIKLIFTGNAQAGNTFASLYDIAVSGTQQ